MRGPQVPDDRGATLAEVVVAMALAVLVAGLGGTQLVSAQRSAAQTTGRVQALEAQRAAFARVPRMLRTATPIGTISSLGVAGSEPAVVSGTATELVVHVNNTPGGAPSRVRYAVEGDALVQEQTPMVADATTGTYSVSPAPPVKRTVVRSLDLSKTDPVFTYVQAPAACTPLPEEGCPVALTGAGQDAAVRSLVRGVHVSLWVRAPEVRTGSSTRLTSRVTFPTTQELRA